MVAMAMRRVARLAQHMGPPAPVRRELVAEQQAEPTQRHVLTAAEKEFFKGPAPCCSSCCRPAADRGPSAVHPQRLSLTRVCAENGFVVIKGLVDPALCERVEDVAWASAPPIVSDVVERHDVESWIDPGERGGWPMSKRNEATGRRETIGGAYFERRNNIKFVAAGTDPLVLSLFNEGPVHDVAGQLIGTPLKHAESCKGIYFIFPTRVEGEHTELGLHRDTQPFQVCSAAGSHLLPRLTSGVWLLRCQRLWRLTKSLRGWAASRCCRVRTSRSTTAWSTSTTVRPSHRHPTNPTSPDHPLTLPLSIQRRNL